MTSVLFLLVLLSLAANVALGAVLLAARRRWRDERDELARLSYERALGADRRLDFVDSRLESLERRSQVDGLFSLLSAAEISGRLDAPRARRLEGRLLSLRDEIRTTA